MGTKFGRAASNEAFAACEMLEARRFLTTYTYTVPNGHSAVYLVKDQANPGRIAVHLDSLANPEVSPPAFTNTTGQDVIDCGTNTTFTFVDQVPAAFKPDGGIKVQGGTTTKLRIESGPTDQDIRTTDADTIVTTDGPHTGIDVANSVSAVELIVNDAGEAAVNVVPDNNYDWTKALFIETGAGTGDTITIGGASGSDVSNVTVHTGAGDDVVTLLAHGNGEGTTTATIDFDEDLGSDLGAENVLNVGDLHGTYAGYKCYATLARASGTRSNHELFMDQLTVAENASVTIAAAATIGDVVIGGNAHAVIQAPLNVLDTASTDGTFVLENSTDVEFTGGADLTTVHHFETELNNTLAAMQLDSGSSVTVQTTSSIGNLSIPGSGELLMTQDGGHVLRLHGLDMGETASGLIDLSDNNMVIDYDNADSPIGVWDDTAHRYTKVTGYIQSGRNGGGWDGQGIIASEHLGADYTTLGIAEARDVFSTGVNGTHLFEGVTVTGGAVIVKYTYGGDANVDGKINVDDYGHIDSSVVLTGVLGWYNGDFNYDGKINVDDYGIIDFNVSTQGSPL
jgi:hypothetical protein